MCVSTYPKNFRKEKFLPLIKQQKLLNIVSNEM